MNLIVISGLGEHAISEAHGLGTFARQHGGLRLAWHDKPRLLYELWSLPEPVIVGHSFGGSVAVQAAAAVGKPCRLYLIDPVPTGAWDRWIRNRIKLSDNVVEAVAYMRGTGLYPFSKRITERAGRWGNVVVEKTDHNSVVVPALKLISEKLH